MNRRRFMTAAVSLAAVAADDRRPADDLLTPESDRAVERGLAFLANQQMADGSFGSLQQRGNVAVTALAGLAFLAHGSQPGRGPYGEAVSRALEYVLSRESRQIPGFLYHQTSATHQGPMYSHGFGALFVAECHGTVTEPAAARRIRDVLERSVRLILASQNGEGGWRYRPVKEQADISVTICQIMALRAARNAGLFVPKSAVDKCIDYVKACQAPDGGFRYFKQGGSPAFARSAAGVVALYCAGVYEGKEIDRGLRYLMQFKPGGFVGRREPFDVHYYYGHYYAAQAMWTAGGAYWSEWFPAIRDELVRKSRFRGDGAWDDPAVCPEYGTAMACIILQIPNNYLPILQK